MKILLTNDDGIASEGLKVMHDRLLSDGHDLWVVAPEWERSGTSHAITLRNAVRITEVSPKAYACAGTPADCVLYSLLGAIDFKPDLVVSGINHGANIGTDIIYSGTVAAARQAALMKYPAVAVSVAGERDPFNFGLAADFVARNLDMIRELWDPDHFLNINAPNIFEGSPSVRVTFPARRIYRDEIVCFAAPRGERYYFLQGSLNEAQIEAGSDWDAVMEKKVSVSPIYLHPLNQRDDKAYHQAEFQRPNAISGG